MLRVLVTAFPQESGLWTAGVVLENDPLEAAKDRLVGMSMLRKRPTIQEFADTAAFQRSRFAAIWSREEP